MSRKDEIPSSAVTYREFALNAQGTTTGTIRIYVSVTSSWFKPCVMRKWKQKC